MPRPPPPTIAARDDVEHIPDSPGSSAQTPPPVPLDSGDSSSENLHEPSSAPRSRAGSQIPEEGNPEAVPEDSVTCQWEECGIVFTHLPTLIDHIHNGEL